MHDMAEDIVDTDKDEDCACDLTHIRLCLGKLVEPVTYGSGSDSYANGKKNCGKSGAGAVDKRQAKTYRATDCQRYEASEKKRGR